MFAEKTIELEICKGNFTVSTDKSRLDVGVIHNFLRNSYWARHIPLATVQKAIENSLCFGVYDRDRQIGFARVVSDYATFAYLDDLFILEEYRGQGLARWLLECIKSHPELRQLARFTLATRDVPGLYAKVGFRPLSRPERFMGIYQPDIDD